MDESNPSLKCLQCGGTDFKRGDVFGARGTVGFRPDGNWITTYLVRANVCLRCGFVILAVDRNELAGLRSG
jgi:hypothetical protein